MRKLLIKRCYFTICCNGDATFFVLLLFGKVVHCSWTTYCFLSNTFFFGYSLMTLYVLYIISSQGI